MSNSVNLTPITSVCSSTTQHKFKTHESRKARKYAKSKCYRWIKAYNQSVDLFSVYSKDLVSAYKECTSKRENHFGNEWNSPRDGKINYTDVYKRITYIRKRKRMKYISRARKSLFGILVYEYVGVVGFNK